jgi:hypothetical protein
LQPCSAPNGGTAANSAAVAPGNIQHINFA